MLLEIPLADATAALPVFDTTDIAEILNQGIRQVGSVLTTSTAQATDCNSFARCCRARSR
ncbi:hypothetical protein LAUMK142_01599 [Mycobacterium pseudokansasii]|uniref:Uncharacterized protein n=1 Tax=Mycobacterium pseudokansasii TaxID=2341080 RepID=A0A498QKT0_9MYCO|nr:hypothetical protein LAUMK142_01599 [Mycobacterium pseudokansasii]